MPLTIHAICWDSQNPICLKTTTELVTLERLVLTPSDGIESEFQHLGQQQAQRESSVFTNPCQPVYFKV